MPHLTLIATAELADIIGDAATIVVDARHDLANVEAGEQAWRAAHLPGAFFVHLDRDLSGPKTGSNGRHPLPDIEVFAATMSRIGVDSTKQVVVYDQNSGMVAARLWWMLRWLGHSAVAVLDGGFDKWQREGRPLSADTPSVRAATFAAKRTLPTVWAEEIVRQLGSGDLVLIDARAPERYRGEVEPFDPVAGHIPGALNRPCAENLLADGTFKRAADLRTEFDRLLASRTPAMVVQHCGSGVTACHNILAMEIAGLPGSRLYPGSWSEWCSDPTRPVERAPQR